MNKIAPITPDMVVPFLAGMAAFDRADLDVASRGVPADAIFGAARNSVHTFAGLDDDIPIFMGGVMPAGLGAGHVWMLGAEGIARAKKFYLRATRAEVAYMSTMFPVLHTTVDDRYTRSLRWLDWLGFTIGNPFEWESRTVRHVELRR